MGNTSNSKCVFCDIAKEINDTNALENQKILKHNEKLALFADIRPASKHHYLVIPQSHMKNAKDLHGSEHKELVEAMHQFGKEYLSSVASREEINDALYGFHFPPFISVNHLHMHVISPSSTMSFINSNLFRKNSWYFVSPEVLIDRLKQSNL